MPYSSGTYSMPSNSFAVPVTGTTISSSAASSTWADFVTALSTCVLKDGTQTITGNIPMSSFKLTGLAAGSTSGDSVRYEQVLLLTGGTLTGNLLFTDATYDIGASGATRPRDLFMSRNLTVGGTIAVTGHATFEGVTSTGATGTGKLVFDTSPTLVTPVLGAASATSLAGAVIAAQSDQETGTSTSVVVTPGRQHFHLSAAKAWCNVDQSSTTATLTGASFNVSSITDGATGIFTINLTSAFSASTYTFLSRVANKENRTPKNTTASTTAPVITVVSDTGSAASDEAGVMTAFFGDLA